MTETTDATAIFAPLWRRKWLILAVGVVVAVASYLYYKHEKPTFSSSTQLYLGASSEEAVPGEKASGKGGGANLGDQATIIQSIVVEEARRHLRAIHKGSIARGAKVKAKAAEKSSFITISAEGHTAKGTALLVNEVAQAYIRRHNRSRERTIDRAIATTRRQLLRLEAANAPIETKSNVAATTGKAGSTHSGASSILQQANLSTKIDQLEASLAVPGAEQLRPASRAQLLSPEPKKDAIFGFVIGIVLAAIAAYVLGRFDRRLRTLGGIESMFGPAILTALPQVTRPIVDRDGERAPARPLLEPLRRLHTSLQLGPLSSGEGRRVILFLSADAGDGKSAIVADLALVQRDGGERVAIVEANFRRPIQARMLGLSAAPGLEEVLAGTLSIDEAQQLPTMPALTGPGHDGEPAAGLATAIASRPTGSLFLLAGSQAVANPPALIAGEEMAEVLRSLGDEFDYVLIDAPSPLEVSDVMPLLRIVDGIVLVARAGHTREVSARRLMQLIAQSSTVPVLGTVANCVTKSDIARQGLSTSVRRGWLSRLLGS
ncbi:MAG TPA: Wzz/FepE/Etk N-terminal domain-containing protein [Solirubrobacteraceae bacterium]|nr:Wzz/FepE/Etk N-terminal domain-containing protein [Solirubrobacteraceae bacterium]